MDCDKPRNEHPFIEGTPEIVAQTDKAILMRYANDTNNFRVVHLWGDDYVELGMAQGEILKEDVTNFVDDVVSYYLGELDDMVGKYIYLPRSWRISLYTCVMK